VPEREGGIGGIEGCNGGERSGGRENESNDGTTAMKLRKKEEGKRRKSREQRRDAHGRRRTE